MEFAEHRDYAPGDDLRHLDWSVLARSEKLVVKEFESELERTVLLVVDSSSSMSPEKARLARECSAALGWVALCGQDRLALATLGASPGYHPPVRGRGQWGHLMEWLRKQPSGGRALISNSLPALSQKLPRSSLLVVISDWLEPDVHQALAYAQYRKHQVAALQVLDLWDRAPPWSGPLRLEDSETSETRELTLDEPCLSLYSAALQRHCSRLEEECRRRGFAYHSCGAEQALEELLLQQLVPRGWLR